MAHCRKKNQLTKINFIMRRGRGKVGLPHGGGCHPYHVLFSWEMSLPGDSCPTFFFSSRSPRSFYFKGPKAGKSSPALPHSPTQRRYHLHTLASVREGLLTFKGLNWGRLEQTLLVSYHITEKGW